MRQAPVMAVTCGSVLFLAVAVHCMLQSAFHSPPPPAVYTITAKGLSDSRHDGKVELRHLFLDDRHVLPDDPAILELEHWQVAPHLGSEKYYVLFTEEVATIRFRARSATFQVLHSAPAHFHVTRDGVPLDTPNLTQGPYWRTHNLDLPARPGRSIFLGIALLGVAGLAFLMRPWDPGRTGDAWVAVFGLLLYVTYWATQPVIVMPDSNGYVNALHRLTEQHITSHFPPGYGFCIAISDLLPLDGRALRVTLVQAIVFVGVMLAVYRMLRSQVPRWVALAGTLAAFSSVTSLKMSHSMLSEASAIAALIGALYFAFVGRRDGRASLAVAAGICAGLSGLIRVTPLAAAFAFFTIVYLWPPRRRGIRDTAIAGATALMVVAVPMGIAWHGEGRLALTHSAGRHLYHATVRRSGILDRDGPATRELLTILDEEEAQASGVPRTALLRERGLDDWQVNDLQRRVAIETLRADPIRYLRDSVTQVGAQLFTWPRRGWSRGLQKESPDLTRAPVLGVSASAISWLELMHSVERRLWKPAAAIYCLVLLVSMFTLRSRVLWCLLVSVPLMLIPGACLEQLHPRYSMPLVPMVMLWLVVGPCHVFPLAWRRWRSDAGRGGPPRFARARRWLRRLAGNPMSRTLRG